MREFFLVWLFLGFIVFGASVPTASASGDEGKIWTEVDDSQLQRRPQQRTRTPEDYRTFRLDLDRARLLLDAAPKEFSAPSGESIIELPMPDGTLAKFRFERSLVVEEGLLAKYPELGSTYAAKGIDDPTATARFDLLPNGFHAMIMSSEGTIIVDPYAAGDLENYVTYRKADLPRVTDFHCEVSDSSLESQLSRDILDVQKGFGYEAPEVSSGGQLREYRLALAATNEYASAVGGNTVAGTLAAQVLIMNRVNGVFERDLSMRMVMIANNDLIVYAGDNMSCGGAACTSGNDPYSNNNGSTMLGQNTTNINSVIQSANYDIGHVFSTGGGGVATLNGPCGNSKARGVTGLSNPVGDAFAIDFVAHEMGHQWGANHTYNATAGGCSGQRSGGSAYEPGSGVTIMSYAGLCGDQDLALHSIDTFHVRSLEAITAFSQAGSGNACAQSSATGNTVPEVSVDGGVIFDIPKQTPFSLTAIATDADGDILTYDWQQYDLGASTAAVPNTDSDGEARPIFRSYIPATSPTRTFPRLNFILNNANVPPAQYNCQGFACLTGELLPQIGRAMTFQVVVRDNRERGGAINTATATVAVDANSGPFEITSQNTAITYQGASTQTVTWNVNGTNNSPVNAANVKISFSTDGGLTFPFVLADSTPNDGSAAVSIPNVATTTGRIKVEGAGKIFFDISNANVTVNAVDVPFVTILGRATSPTGLALRNLRINLIDSAGNRRVATTSSLGTYSFDQVQSNANYTLTAESKRYRFAPRVLAVTTVDLANIDFTGLE